MAILGAGTVRGDLPPARSSAEHDPDVSALHDSPTGRGLAGPTAGAR